VLCDHGGQLTFYTGMYACVRMEGNLLFIPVCTLVRPNLCPTVLCESHFQGAKKSSMHGTMQFESKAEQM
jgi:hypothetical protein